jgi:type IV pilus assembly protein PilB
MQPARLRLGQLLVDAHILSEEELEQVLVAQKADGRKLGTLLVESGLVSETQLTQILSQQLSVPWVSLYHIDFSRELLNFVPLAVAEKYCLVPIYVRAVRGQGDTLYVAMEDPMNEEALRECSEFSGLPARAMIAAPTDIRKAVQTYYGVAPAAPRPPPAPAPPAPAPLAPLAAPAPPPPAPSPSPSPAPAAAAPPAPPPEALPDEDDDDDDDDDDDTHDRPTPVVAYAASDDSGLGSNGPVMAPFMVDEPSSVQAGLRTIPEKEQAAKAPASHDAAKVARGEASPTLEVHEVDMSKRKHKQVQLTLLDGTTIKLPSSQKKRATAPRTDPPSSEDNLTATDLLAALRAAAHGADAAEILGDNLRWEKMFAAILSLLLRKHLIMEKELMDELKKI